MQTDIYYSFLKKYIAEHRSDFVASHETNNTSVPENILQTGLRVSHSPYGRKFLRCLNDDGSIDFDRVFMATMTPVDEKILETDEFCFTSPTAPIVILIPEEMLKVAGLKPTTLDVHKFFSKYGFEQRPTGMDRCGTITPLETSKGANIRLLPTHFIAGYFDIEKGVFVENEKHFSKLPKENQTQIINELKLEIENLNLSQPQ